VRWRRAGRRSARSGALRRVRELLGPFFLPLAVTIAILVALGVGLLIRILFVTSPDQAAVNKAPHISDTRFERAAAAICAQYVQVFNTGTTLGNQPSQAESASFLESIAVSFDQMVAKLRALPVIPADQALVRQWLDQWDQYDAFGHTYAVAVKNGTEGPLVKSQKSAIDSLLRTRNAFAKANNMKQCAFS
jgi:hypothetical protein